MGLSQNTWDLPKDDGLGEFKPRGGGWAGVGGRSMEGPCRIGSQSSSFPAPVPSGPSLLPVSFLGRVRTERPRVSEDKGGGEQTRGSGEGPGAWMRERPVAWAPVWAAGFQALGASARPPAGLSDPGGSGFCSYPHLPAAGLFLPLREARPSLPAPPAPHRLFTEEGRLDWLVH